MTYKFNISEGPLGSIQKEQGRPFPTDPPPSIPVVNDWANLPSSPSHGELQRYQPVAGSSSMVVQFNTASSAWIAGSTNDNWVSLPIVKSNSLNTDLFPKQAESSSVSTHVNGDAFVVTIDGALAGNNAQEWRVQSDFLLPQTAGGITRVEMILQESLSPSKGLMRGNNGPVQKGWGGSRYGSVGSNQVSGSTPDFVTFHRYFESGSLRIENTSLLGGGETMRYHNTFSVLGTNAIEKTHATWEDGILNMEDGTVGAYQEGEKISDLTRFFLWVEATDVFDGVYDVKIQNAKIKI